MSYFYSREQIFKFILLQPMTKHGIYWCLDIKHVLEKKGNHEDNSYLLNRNVFIMKKFWTQKDFYYFLAETDNSKLFIEDWYRLNENFNEDNKDILNKKINEKINNLLVSNIIDNYLIFKDYFLDI